MKVKLVLTAIVLLLGWTGMLAQDYSTAKLAAKSSDPGVNTVAYNFKTTRADGYGIGGFMALRKNADGSITGGMIDSVTNVFYTVAATPVKGVMRLTFTGDDGSTFSGVSAAAMGSSFPSNLSGSIAGTGNVSLGTWDATDGLFLNSTPPGTFVFTPAALCTLCRVVVGCDPSFGRCPECKLACAKK
ncbi:MAG: hypothetical protein SF052_01290 [Bacteroidia bacterium]|nr:hypothetical protein [Bacteroidia bacterium]